MKRRLRECVEAWPDCETGLYDPHCCRFPKSCSCTIYDETMTPESALEPARGFTQIQGIRECDAEITCADCDYRLRIIGLDEAAVRRAVTVAFEDHRRTHYFDGPSAPEEAQ